MIPENNRTKELKERWRRWYNARKDWDTQAREDIDFYLGNHYTSNEANVLAERNQSNTHLETDRPLRFNQA